MAELLLELLSEEIPARMQAPAAQALERLLAEALAPLAPRISSFSGPRRIAAVAQLAAEVPASTRSERGPRTAAPEAALAGFLRKHGADRDRLRQESDYWMLDLSSPARPAAALIAEVLPNLLRRFAWPKSMRWGTSGFTWVRPLRRILCILDGQVVPFDLRDGDDDGHGLASGNLTEGHRFMAPGAVAVSSAAEWTTALRDRFVIADAAERLRLIKQAIGKIESDRDCRAISDDDLLNEVTGLVEWPVVLQGQIDPGFMDLPAEVMRVSMQVNQRYFQLLDHVARPMPRFVFVANIAAPDDNVAIIAGNERVLRARFADARHFWDLDRAVTLESRIPALHAITFHAKLGTQADRVRRLVRLAAHIATLIDADVEQASDAAALCKADLTTGLVGEFPELQGVIGGYYALHDGKAPEVARAIREQYLPKGPQDDVPRAPVSVALGLADRLDTLVGFFGIGEAPTGSGDPYALRRAALGLLRFIWGLRLRLRLRPLIAFAAQGFAAKADADAVLAFIIDRLRVLLRAEGSRHDILDAVFAAGDNDDLALLRVRMGALNTALAGAAGSDLLAGYRRAANILRIENRKDGPHTGSPERLDMTETAEIDLHDRMNSVGPMIEDALNADRFEQALELMALMRPDVDVFFDKVTVNDKVPRLRNNRLKLLGRLRDTMDKVADFSRIEG